MVEAQMPQAHQGVKVCRQLRKNGELLLTLQAEGGQPGEGSQCQSHTRVPKRSQRQVD